MLKASAGSSSSGTSFTGSLAATQVAFGSGANAIAGSANFTYNDTKPMLTVGSGATTLTGIKIGHLIGVDGFGALYCSNLTESGANFSLGANGTDTVINAPSGVVRIGVNNGNQLTYDFSSVGRLYPGVDGNAQLGLAANRFSNIFTNAITLNSTGPIITTQQALTNNAAAQIATMTNGPTAGNPTKWIAINDNGTVRNFPVW